MNSMMLIVDDLDINRDILREMFKDEFTILEACDGEECIETVKRYGREIAIILLDLFMPGISGLDVLKARKEVEQFSKIPVVVITADNDIESQLLAFNLGATDYVTKPFVHAMVLYRIHNVLTPRIQLGKMEQEKNYYQVQAERDLLTELYNKVTTEKLVANILCNNKNLCALLVIDIDNFKRVNDVLGHLMGDHVIRTIAGLIAGNFRQTDIVGRIGGDEFLVFMANVSNEEIVRQKIRDLLNTMQFQCNHMLPMDISISIGLSFCYGPVDYLEQYNMSDEALYVAKERGKAQYAEYGVAAEQKPDHKKEKVVLVYSPNRNTRRIIEDMEQEFQVADLHSLSELPGLFELYGADISLLWIDISSNSPEIITMLRAAGTCEELKGIPYIVLCAEAEMEQYRIALDAGASDIVSVPIDEMSAKRRMLRVMGYMK